ncbi:shikimate kinase [Ferruginibacter sp.]|uniref:shikimate kinase n=1 Tax=Ferruginibacter sp. TaxID=1940288 RepID=UPI0019885CF8|nr:shikimate kinase [Ferruginibacter sp.]MBC7627257.1 shikimate kinase [Ferruginibacter sp.]
MIFFLIGFMGSGKTHWGKIWSQTHGCTFIDLDEHIEKKEGQTVADIFEHKGEKYFRKIEAETLRSFKGLNNTIVACGGGTPCFYENMQWMNEYGITIYLSTSSPKILERVLLEQEKRPLLKKMNPAELLFFIEQKLKERAPFYNAAKHILPSENLSNQTFGNLFSKVQSSF